MDAEPYILNIATFTTFDFSRWANITITMDSHRTGEEYRFVVSLDGEPVEDHASASDAMCKALALAGYGWMVRPFLAAT